MKRLNIVLYLVLLIATIVSSQSEPFAVFENREVVILNWGALQGARGGNRAFSYLSADNGYSVYLTNDFYGSNYVKTHWKVIRNSANDYSFKNLGVTNPATTYLDAQVVYGTDYAKLYLAPETTGGYTGTHYKLNKQDQGDYQIYSLASDLAYSYVKGLFIDADVVFWGSVYLNGPNYNRAGVWGAYWIFGYANVYSGEIRNMLTSQFSGITSNDIVIQASNETLFNTLEDATMTSIRNSDSVVSNSSNLVKNVYDSNSFAFAVKAAATLNNRNQVQVGSPGKLISVGIIWSISKSDNSKKSFNFFVTPWSEVRVMDPVSGTFYSASSFSTSYTPTKFLL